MAGAVETEPTFNQHTVDFLLDWGPSLKPSDRRNRRIEFSPDGDKGKLSMLVVGVVLHSKLRWTNCLLKEMVCS